MLKACRKYGLSEAQFEYLMQRSGNRCEVCGSPPTETSGPGMRLHIDHCHNTGRVRGVICANCNRALGQVKDSAERLRALAHYLENVKDIPEEPYR